MTREVTDRYRVFQVVHQLRHATIQGTDIAQDRLYHIQFLEGGILAPQIPQYFRDFRRKVLC